MLIFYVNLKKPWRHIRVVEAADTIVCEKHVWVTDKKGARRQLGTSAFTSYAAACRVRLSLLLNQASSIYPKYGVLFQIRQSSEAAIAEIDDNDGRHPIRYTTTWE